jgi:DNA-binding CsgD family transcriptional regulator
MPGAERRMEGRNGQIWREYVRGATQEALAEKYGIGQQRVSQILAAVREKIGTQERSELIAEEIDLFRDLRADILATVYDAKGAPVTAGKDGDIVRDPETGEVVRDASTKLAALARVEALSARMHKLLGLEATQKIDVNVGEEEASRRAAAEALSRLHGGSSE